MADIAAPLWPASTRPLSDIREITEPSVFEGVVRKSDKDPLRRLDSHATASGQRQSLDSVRRRGPQHFNHSRSSSHTSHKPNLGGSPRSQRGTRYDGPQLQRRCGDQASIFSIPTSVIPPRSSSRPGLRRSNSLTRYALHPSTPLKRSVHVQNRGRLDSPIRFAAIRPEPDGKHAHSVPSRTIIKTKNSALYDVLSHPHQLHPRLNVKICLSAPLFVGGSSVEGVVRLVIDGGKKSPRRRPLTLERACVDLMGIEELSGAKRHIFLALANELTDTSIDTEQDTAGLGDSVQPGRSWILVPSVTNLPFLITLPLEVGPPPFQSKHASIRYMLSATLLVKEEGRLLSVRCSQDLTVLSVYDPEKALISLPSPLTVSDEHVFLQGRRNEKVTVTAGLHRQVWVSGTDIFVDVQVVNNSSKTIKRLELQLERIILCYRHAAAATLEMSASGARLFDQLDRTIVCKAIVRRGVQGWTSVMPYTTDLRTCDLEVPRGHATIKCKKYFEVRYYLNVVAGTSHMNVVTVQLPIILIHMNSLDVPTNSVAQVAAAIDEKRGASQSQQKPFVGQGTPRLARHSSRNRLQGRAFSAPRRASSERQRRLREQRENQNISAIPSIHNSPLHRNSLTTERKKERIAASAPIPRDFVPSPPLSRQLGPVYRGGSFSFQTPPSNRKGRLILEDDAEELRRRFGHVRNSLSLGTNTTVQQTIRSGSTVPPRASSAMGRPTFAVLGHGSGPKKSLVKQRSLDFAKPPSSDRFRIMRRRPNRANQ